MKRVCPAGSRRIWGGRVMSSPIGYGRCSYGIFLWRTSPRRRRWKPAAAAWFRGRSFAPCPCPQPCARRRRRRRRCSSARQVRPATADPRLSPPRGRGNAASAPAPAGQRHGQRGIEYTRHGPHNPASPPVAGDKAVGQIDGHRSKPESSA